MSRSKAAPATTGIPVLKSYRMCRKSNVKPPAVGDNANWERIKSRPPYHIASLDLNHIGSYTSHAHDFQSPDNIIMVRSTDQRTIAEKKGTQPPKLKTVTVSTVETYNRNQNTVRKLTTKSVDGVVESKETIVTDITRAPLLGSQVNLRADKLKSPPSYASTPSKSQTLPRQSSNVSVRSAPRTPQKSRDINREEFAKQCLERHNEYRARHKLDPLKLSPELSAFAQEWADHLASILKMMHRPNNKYGENLWMYMTTDRSHRAVGGDAVDSWYNNELAKYKFGTEPRDLEAGHLTQVLWASSEYLGVGVAKTGEYTFVVCNYDPPGNYKGEYVENVPPIGNTGLAVPRCQSADLGVTLGTPCHRSRSRRSRSRRSRSRRSPQDYTQYQYHWPSPPQDYSQYPMAWSPPPQYYTQYPTEMSPPPQSYSPQPIIVSPVTPMMMQSGWKDSSRPARPATGTAAESLEDFVQDTLRIHNEYRAKHGVPPLRLDANITKFAQSWADQLAERNQFQHRPNNPYGENLFWSSTAASAQVMVNSWYSEENGYDYDVDPFRGGGGAFKSGHFTQMVWKNSELLGVGRARTRSGAMIAVCNYDPRGNIINDFLNNVFRPNMSKKR